MREIRRCDDDGIYVVACDRGFRIARHVTRAVRFGYGLGPSWVFVADNLQQSPWEIAANDPGVIFAHQSRSYDGQPCHLAVSLCSVVPKADRHISIHVYRIPAELPPPFRQLAGGGG